MNHYLKHLDVVTRAITIDSPTSFRWFGKPSPRLPRRIRREIPPELARAHLIFTLQNQLYNDFYRFGFAAPSPSESEDLVASGGTRLVEQLSAANSSSGCWEPGWEVRALKNGTVVISRGGLELWVRQQDCRARDGAAFAPGAEVSLCVPKESFGVSPGYYVALSDVPLSWDRTQTLVRLYWNVRPDTATRLVQSATSRLNEARLPFRLKVLSESTRYGRCDAGVLYMLKSDHDAAAPLLAAIHADIADGLNPGTPVFTKWLALGVGLAEDPGQGESFGQHRCKLLAEGMVRAYEEGKTSPETRLDVVIHRFAEAGIDLERPYLNPGSRDDYHFQPPQRPRPNARLVLARAEPAAEQFLSTAAGIGWRLSREAVWDQGRCNWLGVLPQPYGGKISLAYGAMGPDIYDGTSGIALFLAELYIHTGEWAVRRAALGAIRQALWANEKPDATISLGLYNGTLGVALAAVRIGTVLGEDELLARAGRLLEHTLRERSHDREYDLLSGRAGGIAALIVLRDVLGDPRPLELASQLGDELLDLADETDGGYSWRSAERPAHRNLTGLSHGTAGVGYALLELYQATGEKRYRSGGELAFQYERSWFSLEAANWPDLRDESPRGGRQRPPLKFLTQWCHGAPGIALTRLRAYELLGDDTLKDEARVGLQSTHDHTAAALDNQSMSYSLCHGLCGNAEVLLDGGRTMGWEELRGRRLAHDIAQEGIETYGAGRLPWPCGIPIPSAETPGLFLGLAGIGRYYLRLHDPAIPSLLLLRAEEFASCPAHDRRERSVAVTGTGSNAIGAANNVEDWRQ